MTKAVPDGYHTVTASLTVARILSLTHSLTTAAGPYALKQYPADDRRDRQGAEARALAFLARAGICVKRI